MRLSDTRSAIWTAAIVALFAVSARAAEPESEPQALYRRGSEAYRAGRYHEATELLARANGLEPHTELAYDLGRAYELDNELERAVESFREYLRLAPKAQDRLVVEAKIHELEGRLANQPPPPKASATEAPLPSATSRAPATPAAAADATDTHQGVLRRIRLPTWIAGGVGVAALGTAAAFLMAEQNAESDVRSAPTQLASQDAYRTAQLDRDLARLFVGIGGAAVVTCGVLLTIDLTRTTKTRQAAPSRGLTVAVGPLSASVQGRF